MKELNFEQIEQLVENGAEMEMLIKVGDDPILFVEGVPHTVRVESKQELLDFLWDGPAKS